MTTRRSTTSRSLVAATACLLALSACSASEDDSSTARQAGAAKTYEVCFENTSSETLHVSAQNGEPEAFPIVSGERLCVSSLSGSSTPPTMRLGGSERDQPCAVKFEQYTGSAGPVDALSICGRPNLGSKTESWRVYVPEEIEMTVTPSSPAPNLAWNLMFEDYP